MRVYHDRATFSAEFPDDSQWDDQGTEIVPGGRTIAQTIRERLLEQGVSCSDLDQHSFYGWTFDVSVSAIKWCLIITTAAEGWMIQFEQEKSLLSRVFGNSDSDTFTQLLPIVHHILTSDTRFSNILWHTRSDYEGGKQNRARHSPQ